MRKITQEEYNKAYDLHQLYLKGDAKGKRIIFVGCDLIGVDFKGRKDLSGSNLSGSNLSDSNLSGSDLSGSNLSDSNLAYSNLRGSNLSSSNLACSNLSGSNLSNADITYLTGNMKEVVSMQLETWKITAKKDELAIGCKQYFWKDWESFSDDEIGGMDEDALEFWRKWKDVIFEIRRLKFGEVN